MKLDDKTKIILKKLDEAAREIGTDRINEQVLFSALNFYIVESIRVQQRPKSNLVQLKRKIVPFKPRNRP